MASSKDKRLRRKVRRSYIISTMSIALVLFMLGLVSYVTLSAISAARGLRNSVVVSVEIADSLSGDGHRLIVEQLEATGRCTSMKFIDKESKLMDEQFRRQFEVDLELLLDQNPLRDSYEVTLTDECSTAEAVDEFCNDARALENVEYVSAPPVQVVETMHRIISTISVALLRFLAVLLVISILLLNNTIRLAIYSKRYLINTMKLVGATKWYIMRPLLASALKQGIIAGIIGGGLVCGIVYGAVRLAPEGISMLSYEEVGVIIAALILMGVVITVGFSAFAVNKFVNMRSNKIYLY